MTKHFNGETAKICFLIPSVSSGGIEMYLLRFLRYVKNDERFDITVLVRNSAKGELYAEYQKTGVRMVFNPLGYVMPNRIINYYSFFKREDFNVVCDFNANFAGIPMLLSKLAGVPKRLVFYRQGRDHFTHSLFRNWYNKLMNRFVYQYATQILSNSQSALNYFFPNKENTDNFFKVIYNGVDLKEFEANTPKSEIRRTLELPKDKYIVGHVGRLDPAKNHHAILNSFKLFKKKYSDVHLVLCGRDTEELKGQVNSLGLINYVSILGYRSDVSQVLKSFDCFVFPSLSEGQPNALIEAMITGLPVIASNIDPIKECMPDNFFQWLVDPTDTAILTAKMIELRTSKYDVKALKAYAIDHFDPKQNFELFRTELING